MSEPRICGHGRPMSICGECFPTLPPPSLSLRPRSVSVPKAPRTYQELVAEYKRLRAADGSGIGDSKATNDTYFDAQVEIQKVLREAHNAWFEIRLIHLHICQNCWNEDDICRVCGADGRQ